jgi:hypothetical protein
MPGAGIIFPRIAETDDEMGQRHEKEKRERKREKNRGRIGGRREKEQI